MRKTGKCNVLYWIHIAQCLKKLQKKSPLKEPVSPLKGHTPWIEKFEEGLLKLWRFAFGGYFHFAQFHFLHAFRNFPSLYYLMARNTPCGH